MLEELTRSVSTQETFLGMKGLKLPSTEELKVNASRIVQYSLSPEYKTWSKAVWAKSLYYMDKIMTSNNQHEIDFYRGAFKASQDILRVPYFAEIDKQKSERSSIINNNNKSTAPQS